MNFLQLKNFFKNNINYIIVKKSLINFYKLFTSKNQYSNYCINYIKEIIKIIN